MTEWLFIISLFAVAWFWFENLRAREIAVKAAKRFCTEQGLQFLDDTVASISIKPERDQHGRLVLARTYHFEFSDSGDNRLSGTVTMLGKQIGPMHLEAFNDRFDE